MGITHKWEGTTLIVSSDSGTSSCDLKGDKGETGVRGPQGKPGVVSNSEGVNIDLSDYALKSEMPTNVSQLTNDRGYLTSVPSEYITETELNNKNYLTSVPSEYITETELNAKGYLTKHQDLSGYAQIRDLPTKTSQLVNDSGYIKASELETGEANWNSIKDYLLEPMEVAITWDGNTEDTEYIEMSLGSNKIPCYKVSNIIVRAADFGWGNMEITYENGITDSTSPNLAPSESNGKWFDINYGVGCVFDSELSGYPTGIYFFSVNFSGNGMPIGLSPIMVEKLKEELLPANIGGSPVPFDGMTVKSKTFTTVTSVYEWLEENFNKVLKAIMRAGSSYSFTNMTRYTGGSVVTYGFNLTDLFDMSGNVIKYVAYLVVIKPQSLEFTASQYEVWEGTINTSALSCTTNDTQIFTDEMLQAVGGEFTVLYVD